jgi:CheY-like chemotaxis protein
MPDPEPGGSRPPLTRLGFVWRLAEEVARVGRKGGFLSLVLVDLKAADGTSVSSEVLHQIAERLRSHVRLHDVLALEDADVAILMPDTTAADAARAADRLLRIGGGDGPWRESAGIATGFGHVEGGGEALLAAAADALREAGPGEVALSRFLDGRPRILVVDDDFTFAQVLAETISERGWQAHPCSNVDDAKQRLLEGSYSGLFVDLMLPGSSGIELLRRGIAANPRRPAVLMSGQTANQEAVLEALDLGPVTFVRKPISSEDLDEALRMFRELLPGAPPRRSASG